ncbi:hypothetical protein [Aridibaculum aurantiacum]|uniref:hypothetical protein n=1 Tax=Aridibaculum aurantiacum TaxID=2810307 RepID=UPI001A968A56|nr:hypothetical protein [Aridibaculum aurantiacum]
MHESSLKKYAELLGKETIDLITSKDDQEFDIAFDHWLVEGIKKLESDKIKFRKLDEDTLSSILAAALTTPELLVTREQNSNGHVDLTATLIRSSPKKVKLGEAKIWNGNKYHVKGLGQLLTRYTTGRECRGFVISYVKAKNIKDLFESLREYIDKEKPFDLDGICKKHDIKWSFLSTHRHSSGESVSVCHVGCNLF